MNILITGSSGFVGTNLILGLLKRKQNDYKASVELDINLRRFEPNDPVKYDFALFGLGIYEKFNAKNFII